ncbi:MAG: 1-acyl-sn-glycerol-3-phosphate acyltransferase [Alphaproteobacteria bacterium]|nr:1-acyl-sn-glycerol-3-phosphate acyltransferase [Alphaproteobacteria bacterium]
MRRIRMKAALRVLAIVAGMIACLACHYLWLLLGRRSPWPRRFLAWVGRLAGMRPTVVGEPLRNHVLFVSNHLSWLDIMLIAGATGSAFVSKDDVARWPLIGWLARLNNTVFVARTDRRAVHQQAEALRTALASGQPVALFPEGTTEGGREVLRFRASLLAAVIPPPPGIKVQPVAIDYGEAAHDIAWIGREGAAANALRILSRPGTTRVTLHFLAPIDPSEMPSRKALADAARDEIVAQLDSARPDASGVDASADPRNLL